jgi:REP element-mobilizing transposase RayT
MQPRWGLTPACPNEPVGLCRFCADSAGAGGARRRRGYGGFMPRPPRIQLANGIYHVTGRGNRRGVIFLDDDDRRAFLDILRPVETRLAWVRHASCLLTNHFHLVVETPEPSISQGMQRLLGTYGREFNDRMGFDGHVFQGRFGTVLVESERQYEETCRYVFNNPVDAGLVDDARDWPWSGGLAAKSMFARDLRGSDPLGSAQDSR